MIVYSRDCQELSKPVSSIIVGKFTPIPEEHENDDDDYEDVIDACEE